MRILVGIQLHDELIVAKKEYVEASLSSRRNIMNEDLLNDEYDFCDGFRANAFLSNSPKVLAFENVPVDKPAVSREPSVIAKERSF